MDEYGTDRVMMFHQPFLVEAAKKITRADVLMGKVIPVAGARDFYMSLDKNALFSPEKQLQWLIDSPDRLAEYHDLAEQLDVNMRVNIEIDIGLHRGGVQDHSVLKTMLEQIRESDRLYFSGFMGYEVHITKAPGDMIDHRDTAMALYQSYIDIVEAVFGEIPEGMTFNCGGSQTYQLYAEGDFPFNELCAGSGLVMPTDFDIPTLNDHEVATYIAAPVVKSMEQAQIPSLTKDSNLNKIISLWDPNRKKSIFTYGGYWKAVPESPKGLINSIFYPRSTNQDTYNGSTSIDLEPNDWIFLRPTQSEFVFLQFEGITLYKDGRLSGVWPVLGHG